MHQSTQNGMHFKLLQLAARELQVCNRFKALAGHRICTGCVSFMGIDYFRAPFSEQECRPYETCDNPPSKKITASKKKRAFYRGSL